MGLCSLLYVTDRVGTRYLFCRICTISNAKNSSAIGRRPLPSVPPMGPKADHHAERPDLESSDTTAHSTGQAIRSMGLDRDGIGL